MIHFTFAMNKSRNVSEDPGVDRELLTALGVEPLNARSVILSALLGTHPPTLPVRAIIALAEVFGIRPGTTRTALSRLVDRGELHAADGRYELAGRLLDRQRQQDTGRIAPRATWDGTWTTVVAGADSRPVADRRVFRTAATGARLAELRPDIWMRPANIDVTLGLPDVIMTTGVLTTDDVDGLVTRLWPLDDIEARAQRLDRAVAAQRAVIERGAIERLPQTFTIAAAAVRFLRVEPQLPGELVPDRWTTPSFRERYDDFAIAFEQQLRAFLAAQ
jgi:phenylacetic acid degradation operon negative regulatory protein